MNLGLALSVHLFVHLSIQDTSLQQAPIKLVKKLDKTLEDQASASRVEFYVSQESLLPQAGTEAQSAGHLANHSVKY